MIGEIMASSVLSISQMSEIEASSRAYSDRKFDAQLIHSYDEASTIAIDWLSERHSMHRCSICPNYADSDKVPSHQAVFAPSVRNLIRHMDIQGDKSHSESREDELLDYLQRFDFSSFKLRARETYPTNKEVRTWLSSLHEHSRGDIAGTSTLAIVRRQARYIYWLLPHLHSDAQKKLSMPNHSTVLVIIDHLLDHIATMSYKQLDDDNVSLLSSQSHQEAKLSFLELRTKCRHQRRLFKLLTVDDDEAWKSTFLFRSQRIAKSYLNMIDSTQKDSSSHRSEYAESEYPREDLVEGVFDLAMAILKNIHSARRR